MSLISDSRLVSAMMVTQPLRSNFAKEARLMFNNQTYTERELIVVNTPPSRPSIGMLRNEALKLSTGYYVAQWDDDDYHAPERLTEQINAIERNNGVLCILSHETLECCCGYKEVLAARRGGGRHHSLVAVRKYLDGMSYTDSSWGEDVEMFKLIRKIYGARRIILLDAPNLYTYKFHGGNIVGAAHFDKLFTLSGSNHRPSKCL